MENKHKQIVKIQEKKHITENEHIRKLTYSIFINGNTNKNS